MNWFDGFEVRHFNVNDAQICARVSAGLPGDRPALLLLHGFPQSHVMWHRVAPQLQKDFYLVMPDLRGYGDTSKVFKPLELWQAQCAASVSGQTLPAGQFIPEELPQRTAAALLDFFGQDK